MCSTAESGVDGGDGGEIVLFGVRVKVDPMRKSVSMNNLSQYELPPNVDDTKVTNNHDAAAVAAAEDTAYASADDAVPHQSRGGRERKRGSDPSEIAHSHPRLAPTLPDLRAANPVDNQFEYLYHYILQDFRQQLRPEQLLIECTRSLYFHKPKFTLKEAVKSSGEICQSKKLQEYHPSSRISSTAREKHFAARSSHAVLSHQRMNFELG